MFFCFIELIDIVNKCIEWLIFLYDVLLGVFGDKGLIFGVWNFVLFVIIIDIFKDLVNFFWNVSLEINFLSL